MFGVVQTRELRSQMLSGRPLDIRSSVRIAPAIQDTAEALDALAVLRGAEVPIVLGHDEYGHFEGAVTPADLLGAIAASFALTRHGRTGGGAPADGSWLPAGELPADEMAAHLNQCGCRNATAACSMP